MANRYVMDILINAGGNAPQFLGKVGGALGNVGALAGGALVGGVAAAGAAIAAVGVTAFNTANDIDEASDSMVAALGLAEGEAGVFEDAMKGVFKNNFGDSFEDIGESITVVEQNLRRLDDRGGADLQHMTEQALALRDVFEYGVNESASAATTLMDQFKISGDEAFGFITRGAQEGLDASDDFLDTIGEYSNQFKAAGFDAEQMFAILQQGAQGGVLGTDKVADAIKEMTILLNEGGDDTKAAFEAIGLNFDQIQASVAAGDETWADYFSNIIAGLQDVDDSTLRSQLQVAIFGTMAEDLGPDFANAFSIARQEVELFGETVEVTSLETGVSLEEMAGATDSLGAKYDNLGSLIEGWKRRALVAIAPIGDKMLELANEQTPRVEAAFSLLEEHIPAAIDFVVNAFDTGLSFLEDRLGGNNEQIQDILNIAQRFWDEHGDAIMRIVRNVGDVVSLIFDQFVGNILDIVQLGLQLLTGDWEGAGETLERVWQRTWDTAKGIATAALDSVLAILGEFIPDFSLSGEALIDGLLGGLQASWESVKGWFSGLSWPSLPSLPSLPSFNIPGFASGTPFAPGGLAVVHGGEMILPRGAQVLTANQVQGMRSGGGDVYLTQNFYGAADSQRVGRAGRDGTRAALLSRGS